MHVINISKADAGVQSFFQNVAILSAMKLKRSVKTHILDIIKYFWNVVQYAHYLVYF